MIKLLLLLTLALFNPIGQSLKLHDIIRSFEFEGYGGNKSSNDMTDFNDGSSNDMATLEPDSVPEISDALPATEPPAVEVTEAPTEPAVETTESSTKAPVEATEAPVETTESPTEAPVEATEAPVETTEPPTEAPGETTEAPVETTEAPVETTEAPVGTTEPPVEAETAESGEETIVDVIVNEILNRLELEDSTYPAYTDEEKKAFADVVTAMIEENILSKTETVGPEQQENIIETIITEVALKLEGDSEPIGDTDEEESIASVTATIREIVSLILGMEVYGPDMEDEMSVEVISEPETSPPEEETKEITVVPEPEEAPETEGAEVEIFNATSAPESEEVSEEESTESPTAPVVQNIVTKAVDAIKSYADGEGSIKMPKIDTDKISSIAENVLSKFRDEVGEDNVTEDILEEQADRIAKLIANDFIELEITEGGEPIDMDGEGLLDIISTISDITFQVVYEATGSSPAEMEMTSSPTLPQTFAPTGAPTNVPTEAPTSLPTSTAVVDSIVTKAVDAVKSYADGEGSIKMPKIDTDKISSIAENVLSKFRDEVGEDNVTEDMMEEQADRIAKLIANDFIELEITEGGEPIDMDGEGLLDIISTISDITFQVVYEATGTSPEEMTPSPTAPLTSAPTDEPTEAPTQTPTPRAVIQTIVTKAVDSVATYVNSKGPINMPTIDTDKIQSIAENVLTKFRDEVGEDNVTEETLEEQADRIGQLIANDYIELEITEGGKPVDLSEEGLMDIVSSITDITFQVVSEAEGNR